MNTRFFTNENQIPIFEIEYKDGEKFYLMPFRRAKFKVCTAEDGAGRAGSSDNMYFDDVGKCLDIGMEHYDKYLVINFPLETVRKMVLASAREAIFDHFACSYGNKHIEEVKEIIAEVCGRRSKYSAWNQFITECYNYFGVRTKWDD